MAADRRRRGIVIGIVFALATLFFVWGVSSESEGSRDRESTEQRADEAREKEGEAEAEQEEEELQPLGIDLESTPLVVAAAIVSLIVAGMVAWRPTRGWLLAVLILGIAFAAIEVAEVVRQAEEENTGALLLALAACVTHAVAAVLAANEIRAPRRSSESALTT